MIVVGDVDAVAVTAAVAAHADDNVVVDSTNSGIMVDVVAVEVAATLCRIDRSEDA